MGKNLNKFSLLHLGVVTWILLFGVILSPAASAITCSDLANGWTFWDKDGAVLLTWEKPSSSESSRILGFEFQRNFNLRDVILRNEDEYLTGHYIDGSECPGIEVVDITINPVTGGTTSVARDFISWDPDKEIWQEFLNSNWDLLGTELTDTSVHCGWVHDGPVIGSQFFYQIRPIILVQDRYGQWRIHWANCRLRMT